jgi:hypothetical protein
MIASSSSPPSVSPPPNPVRAAAELWTDRIPAVVVLEEERTRSRNTAPEDAREVEGSELGDANFPPPPPTGLYADEEGESPSLAAPSPPASAGGDRGLRTPDDGSVGARLAREEEEEDPGVDDRPVWWAGSTAVVAADAVQRQSPPPGLRLPLLRSLFAGRGILLPRRGISGAGAGTAGTAGTGPSAPAPLPAFSVFSAEEIARAAASAVSTEDLFGQPACNPSAMTVTVMVVNGTAAEVEVVEVVEERGPRDFPADPDTPPQQPPRNDKEGEEDMFPERQRVVTEEGPGTTGGGPGAPP